MVLGALSVNSRTIYIFMMICDDLICHNSYIILYYYYKLEALFSNNFVDLGN